LVVAVFIILVTDRSRSAVHLIGPIAPLVVWIVEQLLSSRDLAVLYLGHVLVALKVLHAVCTVRKKPVGLGTLECRMGFGLFARPSVAITTATLDQLRRVAPLVLDIIQKIFLAQHMGGTAVVTLPEP